MHFNRLWKENLLSQALKATDIKILTEMLCCKGRVLPGENNSIYAFSNVLIRFPLNSMQLQALKLGEL